MSLTTKFGVRLARHHLLVPGQMAASRGGQIIWIGRIEQKIDGDFDTILVSDADYEDVKRQTKSC